MRSALVGLAVLLPVLAACAGTPQQHTAYSQQCEDFAHSGGYPYLTGGPVYGPNSSIEQLPGAPPLIHGPFDPAIERHLNEESYLRNWCMQNLNRAGR